MNHNTTPVVIRGEYVAVDTEVAKLVVSMNMIPGVETISSCQGDPGIIGEGGHYGHVSFTKGNWGELCSFCWEFLRDLFLAYVDDEIRVEIFVRSEKPYANISFRSEMLELITNLITS